MRGSERERSLACAIRGPVTLITVGVLFALNNFTPYGFHQTWPVLLIVFGLLTLLRRSMEPAVPPAPGLPGYVPPPPYTGAPPSATAGGYRQSQYPDSGAPKTEPGGNGGAQ
jgi:hypothetical protein